LKNTIRDTLPGVVIEKAGLVWVYMGPGPAPLLPDWDRYDSRGYKQIATSETGCNWLACQENSIMAL
jgi:5,5'-dehydrodivanillate O-demethylase